MRRACPSRSFSASLPSRYSFAAVDKRTTRSGAFAANSHTESGCTRRRWKHLTLPCLPPIPLRLSLSFSFTRSLSLSLTLVQSRRCSGHHHHTPCPCPRDEHRREKREQRRALHSDWRQFKASKLVVVVLPQALMMC